MLTKNRKNICSMIEGKNRSCGKEIKMLWIGDGEKERD